MTDCHPERERGTWGVGGAIQLLRATQVPRSLPFDFAQGRDDMLPQIKILLYVYR